MPPLAPATLATALAAAALAAANPALADPVAFSPPQTITTASQFPRCVVMADLDRDGDLDAVVCSSLDNTLAWYEATGTGAGGGSGTAPTYTRHAIFTALSDPRSLAIGDIDRDGWPDIACASFGDNTLRWFRNDHTPAAGGWVSRTISSTSLGAADIVLVDMDHDGDLDAVAASITDNTVAWFESSGAAVPAWTRHVIDASMGGAISVAAPDLDGDGNPDVVAAGFAEDMVACYLSDGTPASGTWTRNLVATLPGASRIACADVNNDGRIDIAAVSAGLGSLVFARNRGAPSFTATTISSTLAQPTDVAIADPDLDGDGDILVATSADNTVHVFENPGGLSPAWVRRTVATGAQVRPAALACADADGDGDPDILCASTGDNRLTLIANQSIHRSVYFADARPVSTLDHATSDVIAADFDGDGDTDIAARSDADGNLRWFQNSGLGASFTARIIDGDRGSPSGPMTLLAAGDLDNDGDTDIVRAASSSSSSYLEWIENDGTPADGGWNTRGIDGNASTDTASVEDLVLTDLDHDGDLDIVISKNAFGGFSGLQWYENTGLVLNRFNRHAIDTFLAGVPPETVIQSVAAGDIDGDGDTDLVTTREESSHGRQFLVDIYLNDGAATPSFTRRTIFTQAATGFPIPVNDLKVALADIDRDGDLDIVTTGAWYENTGGVPPVFVRRAGASGQGRALAAADLDLDGDLDVARFANSHVSTSIRLSDPGVVFGSTASTDPIGFGAIALADMDKDGDLDVVACGVNNRLGWFANRGGHFSATATATLGQSVGRVFLGRTSAVMSVLITHRGRAGDRPEELHQLQLQWQATEGVPLTSAQFNAIIDRLRVYRDDGDGVFNQSTDTLIVDAASTQLDAAGVSFTNLGDGAPAARVPFGAPARFFVAVLPTAAARQQPQNFFTLTLLTDDGFDRSQPATICQDADLDTDLLIESRPNASTGLIGFACPADFNRSGSVTVQDIFDFLAAYFANDIAADFNMSAFISVQDIFDFLAAYFAGC